MPDVIDALITREGGESDDPADKGGRTYHGISEAANLDLWAAGRPTDVQVRERFEQRYVKAPGFLQIEDPHIREQLIDWGVTSGPQLAIQHLQRILTVAADGVLGPLTLAALDRVDARHLNNLVVAARVQMYGRIVQRDVSQVRFLGGWLARAVSFLL